MNENNENKLLVEVKTNLSAFREGEKALSKEELFHRLCYHKNDVGEGVYSLYVVLKDDSSEEVCFLEDVSRDEREALEFLFLFARETVTPDTSQMIMEDLLSVYNV